MEHEYGKVGAMTTRTVAGGIVTENGVDLTFTPAGADKPIVQWHRNGFGNPKLIGGAKKEDIPEEIMAEITAVHI